jgi:hypothetical protein
MQTGSSKRTRLVAQPPDKHAANLGRTTHVVSGHGHGLNGSVAYVDGAIGLEYSIKPV